MLTKPKNTNRINKVNSLIQQVVGEAILPILQGHDGLTTISKVETSRDLRWSKVWVSIIGGDDQTIMKTLHDNIYDIQGELNRKLHMKIVPRLQFFLDTSPRYAQHIDELIQEVHKEDEQS
jgi:ribosome-binding factor A